MLQEAFLVKYLRLRLALEIHFASQIIAPYFQVVFTFLW